MKAILENNEGEKVDLFDKLVKIVNHWTDNKLGDEVLNIAMELQQILTDYHEGEKEIAKRLYQEYLSETETVIEMVGDNISFPDWLELPAPPEEGE